MYLIKECGRNIVSRNAVVQVFDKIDKLANEDIIINFNKVSFISRSSAAEYIKRREQSNKNIIEKNMSAEVKSMFELVINQLKNVDYNFTKEMILH